MSESHAKNDFGQEPITRAFAETYCFPKFHNSIIFTPDDANQYTGTDYLLDGHKCDLKTQTKKYTCSPTPTFLLETAGYGKPKPDGTPGEWKPGWFTKKMLTEFYIWMWIHQAKYGYKGPQFDKHGKEIKNNRFVFDPKDFREVELMYVDAKAIHEAILKEFGFTSDDLYEIACDMRYRLHDFNPNDTELKTEFHNGLKFVMSPWLVECPVNVVLGKEWYARFSPLHYTWKNGLIIPSANNTLFEKRCPHCFATLNPYRAENYNEVMLMCNNECGYTQVLEIE